ncbi:MAG TPA: helix-turn-helix transcriptional regulator [Vicinamibacterales bacterium]|jgi:cytoskeletal protein RodZ
MEPAAAFGPRLRQERERRHISLQSIAQSTKINRSLLEALERDDVTRWPTGIFRRAFIRSYAEAIGLDGDEIVREFVERFPDPVEAARQSAVDVSDHSSVDHAGSPDRVEVVLRFSVPRWWVSWLPWLSRAGTIPRRQDT